MSKQDELNRLASTFSAETTDLHRNAIILHFSSEPGMRISYNLTRAMQNLPLDKLKAIIEQARLIYQKRISGPSL